MVRSHITDHNVGSRGHPPSIFHTQLRFAINKPPPPHEAVMRGDSLHRRRVAVAVATWQAPPLQPSAPHSNRREVRVWGQVGSRHRRGSAGVVSRSFFQAIKHRPSGNRQLVGGSRYAPLGARRHSSSFHRRNFPTLLRRYSSIINSACTFVDVLSHP